MRIFAAPIGAITIVQAQMTPFAQIARASFFLPKDWILRPVAAMMHHGRCNQSQ
jgi:hypothetical protein